MVQGTKHMLSVRFVWVIAALVLVNAAGWIGTAWWLDARRADSAQRLTDASRQAVDAAIAALPPGKRRVVAFAPEGVADDADRFSLVFDEPIVDAAAVGEGPDAAPFELDPVLPGRWVWADRDRLEYLLEERLPPGRAVRLTATEAAVGVLNGTLVGDREFEVLTSAVSVASCDVIREEPGAVVLSLAFTQPVRGEEVAAMLWAGASSQRLAPSGATPLTPGLRTQHNLRLLLPPGVEGVEAINEGRRVQPRIALRIDGDLQPEGADLPMGRAWTGSVQLGVPFGVMRSRVSWSSGDAEQRLATVHLSMSRAVDAKAEPGQVRVEPALAGTQVSVRGSTVSIVGPFEPGHRYDIVLEAGLRSADGAVLAAPQRATVEVPDRNASLQIEGTRGFLMPTGNLEVPVSVVNIDEIVIEARRVYDNALVSHLRGEPARVTSREVRSRSVATGTVRNQPARAVLDLRGLVGEPGVTGQPVGPGVYRVDVRDASRRWTSDTAIIAVTDLGLTVKRERDAALVWVTSLSTGAPVPGAAVTALSASNQVLAQGTTDASGVARLVVSASHPDGDVFVVTAAKHADRTFVQPERRPLRVEGAEVAGRPVPRGPAEAFMYTDRGVYRPGEEIRIGGLLRTAAGGVPQGVTLADGTAGVPLRLTIQRPDGRRVAEIDTVARRDRQGFLEASWTPRPGAQLGVYTVRAWWADAAGGIEIGRAAVLVEAYEPVRIEVNGTTTQERFGPGEPIEAAVAARYLFGAPAEGLRVRLGGVFVLERFHHPNWSGFAFGSDAGTPVRSGEAEATLDTSGLATLSLRPAELAQREPGRWRFEGDLTVTEVGGRSATARVSAAVDTADAFIGLRSRDHGAESFLRPGHPAAHHIAVVSAGGTALGADEAGPVRVRLLRVRREYQIVMDDGSPVWRSVESREQAAEWDVAPTADAPAEISVVPPAPGEYELVARRQGSPETVLAFYAAEEEAGYEALTLGAPERAELVLDQPRYAPGQTAVLSVRTPFDEGGWALVTVERERVLWSRLIEMPGPDASVELPVDAGWRGGALVRVSAVRGIDPGQTTWRAHRAAGAVRLEINHDAARLAVEVQAPALARPGERVVARVRVAEPAAAETAPRHAAVQVFAVDESALLVTRHATPDPFGFFLGTRTPEVVTADGFGDLLPDITRAASIMRIGGDEDTLARLRRSPVQRPAAPPAAVWLGTARVGPSGYAEVAFEAPAMSGRVRLMAVAADEDAYGSGEAGIVVREPVSIESTWPRAAAAGDVFEVPVKVFSAQPHSQTEAADAGSTRTVRLALRSAGGVLEIDAAALEAPITLRPGESATRWVRVRALGPGTGAVHIAAEFTDADGGTLRTAWSGGVAVRPAGVLDSRSGAVRVAAGETRLIQPAAAFGPPIEGGVLRLRIRAGDPGAGDLMPAVESLLDYPHGCAEQTTSRLAAVLEAIDLLERDGQTARAEIARALFVHGVDQLRQMQTRDGGLAYWAAGTQPQPWISANAASVLLNAQRRGLEIDNALLQPLLGYLEQAAAFGTSRRNTTDDATRALIARVLTQSGRPQASLAASLEAAPARLDPEALAELARCLVALGRRDRASALLTDDVLAQGAAAQPTTSDGRLTSPVSQTAALLTAVLEIDSEHAWAPALAERLRSARRGARWLTTLDNAAAVGALARYAALADGTEAAHGEVVINGKVLPVSPAEAVHLDLTGAQAASAIEARSSKGTISVAFTAEAVVNDEAARHDRGLQVRRKWLTREGNPADPSNLRVGDLIQVELRVRLLPSAGVKQLANVAIVDLLPGGVEIEHPRLASSVEARGGNADRSAARADRAEFQDDRVVLFCTATPEEAVFRYTLRVVTPGEFRKPPAQASGMYAPQISSVHGGGRVRVAR